jgi:hypothetical protein
MPSRKRNFDFDYGDEAMLAEMGSVDNGLELRLGRAPTGASWPVV